MLPIPIGVERSGRHGFPAFTILLLLANAGVFAWAVFGPGIERYHAQIVPAYGLVPAAWTVSSLITSQFLHADLLHLVGNLLFLALAGGGVEERIGRLAYLTLYLAGGAVAALVHIAACPGGDAMLRPAVGASGSISAVLGSFAILYPTARLRFFLLIWIFPITFTLPALVTLALWFAEQYLLSRGALAQDAVAYGAHVGGFVYGFVTGVALRVALPTAREGHRNRRE